MAKPITGAIQPPREGLWPFVLITRLKRLIRTHENSSVRLVIATHIIMVALDLNNRATFQSIASPPLLTVWAESPLWIIAGVIIIAWLMLLNKPPRVIWGLWASTGVLTLWGIVNMVVGLTASHPVSLLGPSLVLFIAAPLAWTTADSLQERIQQEGHDVVAEGSRDRSGG